VLVPALLPVSLLVADSPDSGASAVASLHAKPLVPRDVAFSRKTIVSGSV